MADFITASVTTDKTTLLDAAIDRINQQLDAAGLPGWDATDAQLGVILLGTVAEMLADVATVAATVVPAIFRAYVSQLLGIPYQNGTQATVLSTFAFTSAAPTGGYTIEQGTTVLIDGQAFYAQTTTVAPAGATSQLVTLVASQAGTTYNGLGGVNAGYPDVQLNDQIDWIASVQTAGITSGGGDQETDADYQNRAVGELQLQAPRPVVAADFAGMLLSDIAATATGVTVGRATALDGYYPDGRALATGGAGSSSVTCTTTSGSAVVKFSGSTQVPAAGATVAGTGIPSSTFTADTTSGLDTLANVSSFTGLGVGTLVSGAGIPAGASVTATNPGGSAATLSAPASATATGVTITPAQIVVGSPLPTDATFTISAPATASGTVTLTISALAGYGPAHLTCVGSTSNGSPTIASVTPPYPGAIPAVGARVTGTSIPAGATVLASPTPTASSFTVSANATGTNAGETITVTAWTTVQNSVCSFVTDIAGNPLTAASMDTLLAWLQRYRPQNWLVTLTLPSYSTVYITTLVKVLPNYSAASVQGSVQSALLAWLSSAAWGNPGGASTGANNWLNSGDGFNLVRWKEAIAIATVPGVAYVDTLTLGFSPAPSGTADLVMPGPAPLPVTTSSTILVTTE